MAKFKSEVDLVDNGDGTFTLNYNIFSPGKIYTQGTVTQIPVEKYDEKTQTIPGLQIEIHLEDKEDGDPLTLSGSILIPVANSINKSKPFVEVTYKSWDMLLQKYKKRGGAITRGHVPA